MFLLCIYMHIYWERFVYIWISINTTLYSYGDAFNFVLHLYFLLIILRILFLNLRKIDQPAIGSIRADSTNRWRGHLLESKILLTVGWYSHYIITLKRIFDLVNSFKSYGKMKIDFFHFAVTKKMSDFFLF